LSEKKGQPQTIEEPGRSHVPILVTAMMALFIVLWLMNSSNQLPIALGEYFKDPTETPRKVGTKASGAGENFSLSNRELSAYSANRARRLMRQTGPHQDQRLEASNRQIAIIAQYLVKDIEGDQDCESHGAENVAGKA
jgi:flagellar motor protein MotB